MDTQFLTLDEILLIHENQLNLYGGDSGLRDLGLLQSALSMPSAGFGNEYFHKDLYEMAAAYLFHVVKNHPFVDGNKRVGFVAAYLFLGINGIQVTASDKDYELLTLDTAQGKVDKSQIAVFFKKNSKRAKK